MFFSLLCHSSTLQNELTVTSKWIGFIKIIAESTEYIRYK